MKKLIQNEIRLFILSAILLFFCTCIPNSKLALAISLLLGVFSLLNKKAGLLTLTTYVSFRPFLIQVSPGLKSVGDIIIFMLLIRTLFDNRRNMKGLFTFHVFELALFAFGVIGAVTAVLHGVRITPLVIQIRSYFLFYLVFYVVKRLKITKIDVLHFSWVTFIIGMILSIQGIIEKISNKTLLMPEAWKQWNLSLTNQIRVYGLLEGPNELSLYLFICFIISWLLLKTYRGKSRYIFYIGMVLMGTTIMLTYSRGTFLCILIFAVAFFMLKRSFKHMVPILIIFAVSLVMFFGINKLSDIYAEHFLKNEPDQTQWDKQHGIDDTGLARFKGAFSDQSLEQSNESGRLYYVKKSLEVFKDYPIVGSGFATFGGAATLKYSSPIYKHYHISYNFYSDNQYILILAETGTLGVILMLIFVVNLGLITWKRRKKHFYFPILVYFWLAVVVGGTVYNILENDSFMFCYFLLLGLALNNQSKNLYEID